MCVCNFWYFFHSYLFRRRTNKQTCSRSRSFRMCVCVKCQVRVNRVCLSVWQSPFFFFFLVCFCDKVLDNINWKIRQGERVASPRRANGIHARACSLPPIRLWLTPDSIFSQNQDQCKTTLLLLLSHTWRSSTILRLKTSFFYFLHLPATVRIIPDSFILQPS